MSSLLCRTVRLLGAAEAAGLAHLTYPRYRPLLAQADDPSVVALGAFRDDWPVGLALGVRPTGDVPALLASLYVDRPHHGQGLGEQLLCAAEEEFARRGSRQLRLEFHTDMPACDALERLLRRRGWSEPRAFMLRCRGDARTAEAPFFHPPLFDRLQRQLADVQVFPWEELTLAEQEALRGELQAPNSWIPPLLSPFQEDPDYPRSACLGLRIGRDVVGWLITHKLTSTVVRYSWGYVRPDVARRGAYVLMMREAALHHVAVMPRGVQVLWTVPLSAPEMARFVQRRFAPWLCSVAEVREAFQDLAAAG